MQVLYDEIPGDVEECDPADDYKYIYCKCPFIEETIVDLISYQLPIFILLSVNTVFLIWIMVVS